MTGEQHNNYLSWAFIAHGSFQTMLGLLMMAFMSMFFFMPDQPGRGGPPPPGFLAIMFLFVFLFQLAFTVPSFVAAYALRKKKTWARTASIVAAVVAAMNAPIGTATCVYALWFFVGEKWKDIYPETAFGKDEKAEALRLAHERETRWTGYQTDEKGEPVFNTVEPPDWR